MSNYSLIPLKTLSQWTTHSLELPDLGCYRTGTVTPVEGCPWTIYPSPHLYFMLMGRRNSGHQKRLSGKEMWILTMGIWTRILSKLREVGRDSLDSAIALKCLNIILRMMDRHAPHF